MAEGPEGSQDAAVAWLSARFPELALLANHAPLGEEAGKRVGEAEEDGPDHAGRPSCLRRASIGCVQVYGESRPRAQIELTREALRHTSRCRFKRAQSGLGTVKTCSVALRRLSRLSHVSPYA